MASRRDSSEDEETRCAYEQALVAGEADLDLLMDAADFYIATCDEHERDWLERGLAIARNGASAALASDDEDAMAEFAILEAAALERLGEPRRALSRIDSALQVCPHHPGLLGERGILLYELCRFDEARRQLLEVLAKDPDHASAHHTLGLIAERRGEPSEAEGRFAEARRLCPDEFPDPLHLSAEAFDGAVEDALSALPAQVRTYLSNVAITVEDFPADEDLVGSEPPLSPSVLGMFRGAPLGEKASMDPWSHFPSSIVLYQNNLERLTDDRTTLVEEIQTTLLHEVGHFLGLDEHDLWERGLD